MPQYALPSGQKHIGGDEPAGLGVVVPGLQIVPLGLLVVDVPPIAEGVQHAQCGCQGAGAEQGLAPTVIGVFYHGVPVAVNQLDNIPLTVAEVVIIRTIEVHRLNQPTGIIGEPQLVAALFEPDQCLCHLINGITS